ncbi:MAG: hypothetical protein RSD57_19655 [Comamonas sp.]|uniref:hypothetical protein n=1 Tax=Comamonas sp. Z1 TaxID=2601246 RepID=UPI002105E653|nr:hypothetical protein [Comamonas sp. Z1]
MIHQAPIESALRGWRGLAENLGEWAFYVVAVLLVLALVKRFPYRRFTKTHHWIAVVYLVLAFHSVVLVQFSCWAQPVGWALAVLLASGAMSAAWMLLGRVDAKRTTYRIIESLQWKDTSVWFCGPTAFGRALRVDLLDQGLAPEAFHQEFFEMR